MSDYLGEYTRAIEAGDVVAGSEMWQLLTKLQRDRSNPRYLYDTRAAEQRIRFLEACVRLTKAPFYGQRMRPLLWQKAFIEALYSFKLAESGRERYRDCLLLIGRKNGKTELCAGLSLDAFINGPPGSDIICSGNDDGDASILRETIDTMRQMIDPFSLDTHRNQRYIINRINGSRVSKLTQRMLSKEGRGIDHAVVDEVHGMRTNDVVMAIRQSQSLKADPKCILITTEGFTSGGFLDDELVYARKVLAGELDDEASDRYLAWLYTQDSEAEIWQDEKSWEKSNPSIDVLKPRSYFREQLAKARESKTDRPFILCKDFNIKQDSSSTWLVKEDYDYDSTFDAEAFRGSYCLGAVDLSETTDLTCAKVLMMQPEDKTKYVLTRYFLPEAKLIETPDQAAGADYARWAAEGLLEVMPGADLDLALVADWFYGLYEHYELRPYLIGYDQKFARQFLRRLDDYGLEYEMVTQNADTLGNAIRLLEAELKGKRLNYQANPIDKWCLSNASVRLNNQMQPLLVKPQGRAAYRIDGAVCFAILLEIFRRYRFEYSQMILQ